MMSPSMRRQATGDLMAPNIAQLIRAKTRPWANSLSLAPEKLSSWTAQMLGMWEKRCLAYSEGQRGRGQLIAPRGRVRYVPH